MTLKTFVVAVTGASGTVYARRLIQTLAAMDHMRLLVIVSRSAGKVMAHELKAETGNLLDYLLHGIQTGTSSKIEMLSPEDVGGATASGSFVHDGMVVVPCSMKTLSAVASGYADNLIARSADVCLKERRPLIIVPRETPLNLIHLENMTRAARAGALILPACPSYYSLPKTVIDVVDTVVARILDHLGVNHDLVKRWGS